MNIQQTTIYDFINEPGEEKILAKLRKQKGMSQSQLARATGLSVRSIQNYEQGERDINNATGKTIFLLAEALGCTMEDLLEVVINK